MFDQQVLNKRLKRTFRERIVIKKREVTVVAGRENESLVEYYSCLSNPTELYATELYQAINIKLESTAVFEVRYCNAIKEMRFKEKEFIIEYQGHQFNIYQIDFLKSDNNVVLIKTNRVD